MSADLVQLLAVVLFQMCCKELPTYFCFELQANKRLSSAEKELAKAFEHARNTAERRSQKQEL